MTDGRRSGPARLIPTMTMGYTLSAEKATRLDEEPFHGEPRGVYQRFDNEPQPAWQSCEVCCPYCRRVLSEDQGVGTKGIRTFTGERHADGRVTGLAVRVPSTHRLFGCRSCYAFFTQPKPDRVGREEPGDPRREQ